MTEWQPISTAPKDGSAILCYDPTDEDNPMYVVRWDEYMVHWLEDEMITGEWLEAGGERYSTWQPTHWIPLPEKPKE